jgi:alpha-tubulin suppressor-like RCC1 family protein
VQELSGVTSIAGGAYHSLALLSDGTVRAWGANGTGQLGNGTATTLEINPVAVQGLSGVTSVAGGAYHSLALLSDGTVRAWGANGTGQLGNGTTTDRMSASQVPGLSGVRCVAAGSYYSLALLSDGTVRAWGWNGFGQLGDGTTAQRNSPVAVQGLSNIVDVVATYFSSFALSADGRLWAWGSNDHGQLGVGDTTDRLAPVEVPCPLAGYRFASIAGDANGDSGGGHMLATLVQVCTVYLTDQPSAVEATPCQTAVFSVAASSESPLTYRWRRNGSNLSNNSRVSGVTTSSLTISPVGAFMAGTYDVVVTNACGTVTSLPAQLTLRDPADFNGDGDVGTDADIEDFFSCLAGNCCAQCLSADFNNDGDLGTDADIESFFRVLAGGDC